MLCINRRAHQTGRLAARKLTKLYNKHSPANHVQMVTKGGTKWQAGESGDGGMSGEEALWYCTNCDTHPHLHSLLIRNNETWLSSQRDQSHLLNLQKFYCQQSCLKISQICHGHRLFSAFCLFFPQMAFTAGSAETLWAQFGWVRLKIEKKRMRGGRFQTRPSSRRVRTACQHFLLA